LHKGDFLMNLTLNQSYEKNRKSNNQ
jgi:hypothetical protein